MPRSTRRRDGRSTSTPVATSSAEDADRRLHPGYGGASRRLPRGPAGVPGPARSTSALARRARWVLRRRPLTIDLGGTSAGRATSWWPTCATRGGTTPANDRPGLPGGARRPGRRAAGALHHRGPRRAASRRRRDPAPVRDQRRHPRLGLRRRSRRSATSTTRSIDWRGPHAVQAPGRYAPAGQSGSLTIMPGTYGGEPGRDDRLRPECRPTTSWSGSMPSPSTRASSRPRSSSSPLAADRPGSDRGRRRDHAVRRRRPTRSLRSPRFQVLAGGLDDRQLEVDLGTIIRTRPAPRAEAAPTVPPGGGDAAVVGWGTPRAASVDAARRATGSSTCRSRRMPSSRPMGWAVRGSGARWRARRRGTPPGARSIEVLPATDIPVRGRGLLDAAGGEPIAGPGPVRRRRRTVSAAGRPPGRGQPGLLRGHRGRPHPRRLDVRLRPGRLLDRPAARFGRGRGRSAGFDRGPVRDDGRDRSIDPPPRARLSGRRSDCATTGWVTRRQPRPFPRPIDGPAPGGGRGRRPRQPPRGPVGRPAHERDRPARGARWPTRPGDGWSSSGRRTARTCSATSPSSGRGGRRCRSPAAVRRRAGWAGPSRSSWPIGRTAATRPADSSSRPTSRFPTPRSRPTSWPARSTPSRPRPSRPASTTRPIVEWYRFLNLGYRLPDRGGHRQDVRGGADRRRADVHPPRR